MLITVLPGAKKENVQGVLHRAHLDLVNAVQSQGDSFQRCVGFLRWAQEAAAALRGQISTADMNRLIFTDRYWALQQAIMSAGAITGALGMTLAGNVYLEMLEREAAFAAAVQALTQQVGRWSFGGRFVVADTTFYIQHSEKLEEVNPGPLLDVVEGEQVHLLFPMAVIDELDQLKESGKNHVRWRAGYTLSFIDRRFEAPAEIAVIRERSALAKDSDGNPAPVGKFTAEILFDPPGHVRLPNTDDEIIDRAVAISPLVDGGVTLLTYDTGQSTRARAAGLNVVKLQHTLGQEPARS
ncbi:PIN domain-containing protein [Streptosporangium sp. NPDC000563]|uniref:PIN domain-containing protein n=1 Tax=Streptosporangium sp. NPDC000563 TaxID=3154366 RepID=UPI00332D0DC4